MNFSMLRTGILAFSLASTLYAVPDISNLSNCIKEVRKAETTAPLVPTFDQYTKNYSKLLSDLAAASTTLPHVYQEAAAKPLIQFLKNLGESNYLKIFSGHSTDENAEFFKEIIPDAALSIIFNRGVFTNSVNAFQEITSDLYDGFISDEVRVSQQTGKPIDPPTYGIIPPLVKFGNADFGPYTWPCDATSQALGMGCAVVSLPPAQINGGLLAWSALGHETGGHDVTHADEGLLDELAQKVYRAVLSKFGSKSLATYWSNCIDETSADICGYLNMGPSLGIGLIGYFRALGDGTLRNVGSTDDPHPIDLLRGYLAAAVASLLTFKDAAVWSDTITKETNKDRRTLYLVDENGTYYRFPVSLDQAIASTKVVAQTIMQTKLASLQYHSLQELQDWKDSDQAIVNKLVAILKNNGSLPKELTGQGFYAAYVVASATQAALERNADITNIFIEMRNFLTAMHLQNPTWSTTPTNASRAYLDQRFRGDRPTLNKIVPLHVNSKQLKSNLPSEDELESLCVGMD